VERRRREQWTADGLGHPPHAAPASGRSQQLQPAHLERSLGHPHEHACPHSPPRRRAQAHLGRALGRAHACEHSLKGCNQPTLNALLDIRTSSLSRTHSAVVSCWPPATAHTAPTASPRATSSSTCTCVWQRGGMLWCQCCGVSSCPSQVLHRAHGLAARHLLLHMHLCWQGDKEAGRPGANALASAQTASKTEGGREGLERLSNLRRAHGLGMRHPLLHVHLLNEGGQQVIVVHPLQRCAPSFPPNPFIHFLLGTQGSSAAPPPPRATVHNHAAAMHHWVLAMHTAHTRHPPLLCR